MNVRALTLDVPESFETERLLIRGPRPGDGPEFNAAILESLAGIRQWLGYYLDGAPTVMDSEAFMRDAHARFFVARELPAARVSQGDQQARRQ